MTRQKNQKAKDENQRTNFKTMQKRLVNPDSPTEEKAAGERVSVKSAVDLNQRQTFLKIQKLATKGVFPRVTIAKSDQLLHSQRRRRVAYVI